MKRRSRIRRLRRGNPPRITERDIEVFQLLQRYRYLRSTWLYQLLSRITDETFFKKRLRQLFDWGYLDRPPQQRMNFHYLNSPEIYEIDSKGEQILQSLGLQEDKVSDLVKRGRSGANRQFAHAIMICDTLASIELGVRNDSNINFISWKEILNKAPSKTQNSQNPFAVPISISYTYPRTKKTHHAITTIIPDGFFGLEYSHNNKKSYRFFALEAERMNRVYCSNLNQTSWLKKVLAYREITITKKYKTHLGLPNLMVLTVTPTEARIHTMDKLTNELTGGKGSNMFLFHSIPALGFDCKIPVPSLNLLTDPWHRVGRPDFYINKP